jgi:hypothetical protein
MRPTLNYPNDHRNFASSQARISESVAKKIIARNSMERNRSTDKKNWTLAKDIKASLLNSTSIQVAIGNQEHQKKWKKKGVDGEGNFTDITRHHQKPARIPEQLPLLRGHQFHEMTRKPTASVYASACYQLES